MDCTKIDNVSKTIASKLVDICKEEGLTIEEGFSCVSMAYMKFLEAYGGVICHEHKKEFMLETLGCMVDSVNESMD